MLAKIPEGELYFRCLIGLWVILFALYCGICVRRQVREFVWKETLFLNVLMVFRVVVSALVIGVILSFLRGVSRDRDD